MDIDDTEIILLNDHPVTGKLPSSNRPSPSNSAASSGRRRISTPVLVTSPIAQKALLSGIFGVDSESYDITLYSTHISMTSMSGKLKG